MQKWFHENNISYSLHNFFGVGITVYGNDGGQNGMCKHS